LEYQNLKFETTRKDQKTECPKRKFPWLPSLGISLFCILHLFRVSSLLLSDLRLRRVSRKVFPMCGLMGMSDNKIGMAGLAEVPICFFWGSQWMISPPTSGSRTA